MTALAVLSPSLLARAHADQVTTVFEGFHRTTASMVLGALILCAVMREQVALPTMAGWLALIGANQLWRGALFRAWRRARPGVAAAPRWGRYWALGSGVAGALWGLAAWVIFPASPPHQALLIVCLFGVVMGGLNLTAVFRPSFYAFVLPVLLPLLARVAMVGDAVHLNTALVMAVVLAFVLIFGHRLNGVLTESLAMRHQNVDLIVELRDRSRAAQDARQAAERANRAKTQLLAAASHDLRQPLHALSLYVAALGLRDCAPACRQLVSRLATCTRELEAQFGELLDLSRLEAGALRPARGAVALDPLLARIAADYAPQAALAGLRFVVRPTRLVVDSDAAFLERILRNFVSNALRYTRTGGIVVGARRRGAAVALAVTDSGPGIAAHERERIFEEFYQGPRRACAGAGGMGLGLAIVRRLADLLGHAVTVDSVPGRGSRFAVIVPRSDVAPRRAPAPAGAAPGPGRGGARPLAGRRVVLVDDDPAAIDAMRTLFAAWGADVAGGVDAEAARRAAARFGASPDLLVADLRLRDGDDGIAAIARLRLAWGTALPALLLSGDTSAGASAAARAAGLVLLHKPVIAPALLAAAQDGLADAAAIDDDGAVMNPVPTDGVASAPSRLPC